VSDEIPEARRRSTELAEAMVDDRQCADCGDIPPADWLGTGWAVNPRERMFLCGECGRARLAIFGSATYPAQRVDRRLGNPVFKPPAPDDATPPTPAQP
jgi:hypothetical protein